ncbi:MAG: glutathione S-transferase N-terminal domain-containing protein, partial [Gammaproteobacteria bacterium]|nr:glutathione S-transferase N-terminal domain-containing protein [Gammaproteobacteria bacterium]NNJ51078.1 glutaredoxin [Gammaproteobacteria bacterium]
DARYDEKWNQELIDEGGKYQVPCLKITREDGSVEWMYESTDINQYLEEKFSADS